MIELLKKFMDIEDLTTNTNTNTSLVNDKKNQLFVIDLVNSDVFNETEYNDIMTKLRRKYHHSPGKREMSLSYQKLLSNHKIERNLYIEDCIKHKAVRSRSGVLVVTLVMKPDKFSCPYNCHMCPDERIANGATVDMPRSYLSTEPAEMRAMEVDFNTIGQFRSRVTTLKENGHTIDKVEIIVLGGTFSTYPRSYQEEFIRDIFYAANTYFDDQPRRASKSLEEEQSINESANCHIVGLSLETRPDQINKHEIKRLRSYGCTRVQMGVQHTNNDLLDKINRGHHVETSIKAVRMLKEVGFKVELHIMPDLPDTTPDMDKQMIDEVFCGPDFQPDYVKIYPCLDVKYTTIRKWKESGKWNPYAEEGNGEKLIDVLKYALERIPYWTRDSRVQRDFPEEHRNNNHIGYSSNNIRSNLYQLILDELRKDGKVCKSIRNREVKNKVTDLRKAKLFIEKYRASEGDEYFISYESPDRSVLYGYVRLRFNDSPSGNIFEVLKNSALIREVHVYGNVKSVGDNQTQEFETQHYGFGKKLMHAAEKIAFDHGYKKMAVISSVGTRNYYRKLGYHLRETYMVKRLEDTKIENILIKMIIIFLIMYIIYIKILSKL